MKTVSLFFILLISAAIYAAELKVTFFDVGQGDSSLVEYPDGKAVLIDAGMNYAEVATVPQVKSSPVALYLNNEGRKIVDMIIITHPHPDHIGGLSEILKNIKPKVIYGSGDIIFQPPQFGKKIKNSGAELEFLSPSAQFIGTEADENNNSVVVKLTYGKFSVLFTGDIEWAGELFLADMPDKIRSTILKVAHHGSYTSSTSPFIDKVAPDVAVISCGKGNPYGHPSENTLQQFSSRKIRVYRTDENGTIAVTSDGTVYTITTEY